MRYRLAAIVVSSLILAGCSSAGRYWDRYFGDSGADQPVAMASATGAPPPVAAPGGPDPFCAAVARKDLEEGDFDAATQQRMLSRSYAQCMALFRSQ
jgi:hypothetical protein